MNFTVFYPKPEASAKFSVLYFLSGLSCTDENVIIKGLPQKYCANFGVALVAPDTSPRGLNIEGEDDSYDFGTGAGFYLNATVPKWKNYRMEEYITSELPKVLQETSKSLDIQKASIFGHSMGGHGAISLGLKYPDLYQSISAFAPICHPVNAPWGKKAFSGYLGDNVESWKKYDSTELISQYSGKQREILADQGTEDNFYKEGQLQPEALEAAAKNNSKVKVVMRMQDGYNHSYFFISTFMEDHVKYHSQFLK